MIRFVGLFLVLAFAAVQVSAGAEADSKREARAAANSNLVEDPRPQLAPNPIVGPEVPMAAESPQPASGRSRESRKRRRVRRSGGRPGGWFWQCWRLLPQATFCSACVRARIHPDAAAGKWWPGNPAKKPCFPSRSVGSIYCAMRAAVLHGKEQIRVEEVTTPPLQAGEVRVQIEAALTCGTDLKVFKRGYHAKMLIPPTVFGHEFAGVISELAPDVTGWRVGERVAVANSAPCGAVFLLPQPPGEPVRRLAVSERRVRQVNRRPGAAGPEEPAAA